MSGKDPWGDLEYLLMLRQRSPAYKELIDPFEPKALLTPVNLALNSFLITDEMQAAANSASWLWSDIHQTFVDIVGYSFNAGDMDASQRDEYWKRFGRKDDHIKRLKSISMHASALAKLLASEPESVAVKLHSGAGGVDLYMGLISKIDYIERLADYAAAYGTPAKVGELRDDEYYRVSAVRRLIWEPVFSLYYRRFGKLPKHRTSKAVRAITLLHDIIGIPAPSVESLLDAQASFAKGCGAQG